jgi:predicted N-acyltransferase
LQPEQLSSDSQSVPRGELVEKKLTATINEIDENQWKNLVGNDNIEQSYRWYQVVEDSGMRTMRYCTLWEDKTLKAAVCCNVYAPKILLTIPFLSAGCPLGLSPSLFSSSPEETTLLIAGLDEISRKQKVKGLFLLDLTRDELQRIKPQVKGFSHFTMLPNTYLDLDFTDFEDYLSFLDGKARRSVRITLNRGRRLNVKTVITKDFTRWAHTARRLQEYTCREHHDFISYLTEEFYSALEHHLSENAELMLCFKEDIPLAFALSLTTPHMVQYKFSGVDPRYRDHQAYFLLYYEGIRRAIQQRQKRIYFGTTSYEFKEKIGCTKEPHYGMAKMSNPLINLGVKSFIALSRALGMENPPIIF